MMLDIRSAEVSLLHPSTATKNPVQPVLTGTIGVANNCQPLLRLLLYAVQAPPDVTYLWKS